MSHLFIVRQGRVICCSLILNFDKNYVLCLKEIAFQIHIHLFGFTSQILRDNGFGRKLRGSECVSILTESAHECAYMQFVHVALSIGLTLKGSKHLPIITAYHCVTFFSCVLSRFFFLRLLFVVLPFDPKLPFIGLQMLPPIEAVISNINTRDLSTTR